jgi:hypothetical protein
MGDNEDTTYEGSDVAAKPKKKTVKKTYTASQLEKLKEDLIHRATQLFAGSTDANLMIAQIEDAFSIL